MSSKDHAGDLEEGVLVEQPSPNLPPPSRGYQLELIEEVDSEAESNPSESEPEMAATKAHIQHELRLLQELVDN